MDNKQSRFRKSMLVLGAATVTLLCLPGPVYAQSSTTQAQPSTPQDRQSVQGDDNRRDNDRRDVANFDRFLDEHREIAEQVRKDPSLLDKRDFVRDHPALETYYRDNPGVRDQIRQDPRAFMHQEDAFDRNTNMRDHDAGRDRDQRDVANFDRFLDGHREISEQVRKDPSLLDNPEFVRNHPALESYFRDNPGVRDEIRQDPRAFMHQEDAFDRDTNMRDRDRDPRHDHMEDFGGFLHDHSDIRRDLARDPSRVKDHDYVQNHTELDAYLNAHPDVRAELMANPQGFVHGAQQYQNASPNGAGTGVSGRGTATTETSTDTPGSMTGTSTKSTTGTSTTGTTTNPATTIPKLPKQ
jgi:hypothetical protein